MPEKQEQFEFGDFRLDGAEKRLWRKGELVQIQPKAFDLLNFLVENSGHLVSKDELLQTIWADSAVEESNLTINIHALRKMLGGNVIETVPRRGYRFTAEVKQTQKASFTRNTTSQNISVHQTALPTVIDGQSVINQQAIVLTEEAAKTVAVTLEKHIKRQTLLLILIAVLVIASTIFVGYSFLRKPSNSVDQTPIKPARMIAVLPFRNLAKDKDDEYLGVGLSDSLITKLSELKGISVISLGSVLAISKDAVTPQIVRDKLQADSFVEGTIQREDGRIRVSIQLVNATDGSIIWTGQFDDEENSLLSLQDKLTTQIVASMRFVVSPTETDSIAKRETSSPAAFESYVKGRYFWNKRSPEDLKKAVSFFEDAKTKDPSFALAYVGLSDAYQMLSEYGGMERHSAISIARENVLKAIEINSQLGEAYCSLAYIQAFYDWNFPAADASFKKTLALSPNYPTARQWYGEFLVATGKFDESIAELNTAKQLDPLSPIIMTDIVAYYYVTRRFDAAIREAKAVIEIHPNFGFVHSFLALSYRQTGEMQDYYNSAIRADSIYFPPETVEARKKAFEEGGFEKLFKVRYEQATNPPISLFLNNYHRAMEAIEIQNKDFVFMWLEKSLIARDRWLINLNEDPHWDFVRSDPRFDEIIRKINFSNVR